jgi:hypothetical protein
MKAKDKKSPPPLRAQEANAARRKKAMQAHLHLHCATNERGMVVVSYKPSTSWKHSHS